MKGKTKKLELSTHANRVRIEKGAAVCSLMMIK